MPSDTPFVVIDGPRHPASESSEYSTLLAELKQKGISIDKAYEQLCFKAMADAERENSIKPLSVLFSMPYVGLGPMLLELTQQHRGKARHLMARYILRTKRTTSEPSQKQADEWGRTYWAQASDAEKIAQITSERSGEPSQEAMAIWIETIDTSTNPSLIDAATTHLLAQLNVDQVGTDMLTALSSRIAPWLKSSVPARVKAATTLCVNPFTYELGGNNAVPIAMVLLDIMEAHRPQSMEAEDLIGRTAKVIRKGSAGSKQSGLLLERLMRSSLSTLHLRVILLTMLSEAPYDYSRALPPAQRPAFAQWLSKMIMATGLESDPGVYASWILIDPATTASMHELLIERANKVAVAESAVMVWPAEAMSTVIDKYQQYPDAIFLPLLERIVQRHKAVVSFDVFSRLTQSSDGHYRAIAAVTLDAVKDQSFVPEVPEGPIIKQ